MFASSNTNSVTNHLAKSKKFCQMVKYNMLFDGEEWRIESDPFYYRVSHRDHFHFSLNQIKDVKN